jgi:hypothetical protein
MPINDDFQGPAAVASRAISWRSSGEQPGTSMARLKHIGALATQWTSDAEIRPGSGA